MSLKDKINSDLVDAMKSGDKIKLFTIRSIRALILEFEKSGQNKELDENEEIKMLTSAAKKRKESIEQYQKAGRNDLAETEQKELEIIMNYLPAQLNADEIEQTVRKIAKDIGAETKADFGKLMGLSARELKGRADGKKVKEVVEKVLSDK